MHESSQLLYDLFCQSLVNTLCLVFAHRTSCVFLRQLAHDVALLVSGGVSETLNEAAAALVGSSRHWLLDVRHRLMRQRNALSVRLASG